MGFTDEAIRKELQQDDHDVFEIWPEHIYAWLLFQSVQHQWRVPAMGGKPFGLHYPSVKILTKIMFPKKRRRKKRRKVFRQLQLIEAGALKAWPTK